MRSAYDHNFSRAGEMLGMTMPLRAQSYTVERRTPDSAAVRRAS